MHVISLVYINTKYLKFSTCSNEKCPTLIFCITVNFLVINMYFVLFSFIISPIFLLFSNSIVLDIKSVLDFPKMTMYKRIVFYYVDSGQFSCCFTLFKAKLKSVEDSASLCLRPFLTTKGLDVSPK